MIDEVGCNVRDHGSMKEKKKDGDEFIGPRPSYENSVALVIVINIARDEIKARPPYKRRKNRQADEGKERIHPASPVPRDVHVRLKNRSFEFR
ncbi:MAG TPA: hypothetical protein VKB78_15540 [Pirellulales bacterium]|nr:hypothetical protein [Pirellulales bacterium]